MREICILMVDDHSLFRESLARLLDAHSGYRIVGQSASASEAASEFVRSRPDIVLLDYDLGEESAFGLLTEFKRRDPEVKILMVTAGLSDQVTLQIMEAGAAGVFLKHNNTERLIQAIDRVHHGEIWLDNLTLNSMLAGRRDRDEVLDRTRPLTERQMHVLRGILDGLANKEIAWKMGTSESSVKAVIQELFHKAGVRTRSQLVRIAIEKHSADWLSQSAR